MNIYPAVDIKNGRAVRLKQGRADKETVYFENPAEPARRWVEAGAKWLHAVDLDGAFTGTPRNWAAIEAIASTGARVQMGGGLRNRDCVERALLAGVERVVIGTKAVSDRTFIRELVEQHGERIAVGIDAKDGKVAVHGWVDTTDASSVDLAKAVADLGVRTIIYTDIARDGMLKGPNFDAQREMLTAVPCNIIASGGVGSHADVHRFVAIAREFPNFDGVIIGKAVYEGQVDLAQLLRELEEAGVRPVA